MEVECIQSENRMIAKEMTKGKTTEKEDVVLEDHHEDNKDDEADEVESLLSDWNEKDDDEDNNEDPYERLQKQFSFRDRLLAKLSQGENQSYIETLLHHEELVREEAIKHLEEQQKRQGIKPKTEKLKNTLKKDTQILTTPGFFKRVILYETQLAIPGLLALLCYCSFHMAAYEVTHCMVLEAGRLFPRERDIYYISIIVALILLRMTGGAFDWINLRRHALAKFDLHNRIRLGYWDAKLHLWFRRHNKVKFILDYFAIYICLVGMSLIHEDFLTPLFADRRWLTEKLPSLAYDVQTPVSLWLSGLYVPACDEKDEQCSLLEELTYKDEYYVLSKIAVSNYNNLLGSAGTVVTTPLIFQLSQFAVALISAMALKKLGFQWN